MSNERWFSEFPCPICGDLKEILPDKNDHPYLICNSCGLQCFIRGNSGIKRFIGLNCDSQMREKILSSAPYNNSKILAIKERILILQEELKKLDNRFLLSRDESKRRDIIKSKLSDLNINFAKLLEE